MGEGVEGGLVAVEIGGIFDGAVVVDLAPVMVEQAEDAGGAEVEFGDGSLRFEMATFAADGVENFSRDMQRIVVELEGDARGTIEEPLVDATDFGPAALGAAERIVHGNVVEGRPVLAHEQDVAAIESAIELGKRMTGMGEIAKIFKTGDGVERGR